VSYGLGTLAIVTVLMLHVAMTRAAFVFSPPRLVAGDRG
jgi:hypothetical protein